MRDRDRRLARRSADRAPRADAAGAGSASAVERMVGTGQVRKVGVRSARLGPDPIAARGGLASICVETPVDGIPPQDRDGAASARPYLSSCPQADRSRAPQAGARAAARPAPVPRPRGSRARRARGVLHARAVGRRGWRKRGRGARSGLELTAGRGVAVAPLALAALGASLLLRADARRLRPFRVGAIALSLGLLSLLGSDPPRRRVAAQRRRLRRQRPARRGGRRRGRARSARARRVRRRGRPAAAVRRLGLRPARPQRDRRAALGAGRRARRRHGAQRAACRPNSRPPCARGARRTPVSDLPPLDVEQQLPRRVRALPRARDDVRAAAGAGRRDAAPAAVRPGSRRGRRHGGARGDASRRSPTRTRSPSRSRSPPTACPTRACCARHAADAARTWTSSAWARRCSRRSPSTASRRG